MAPMDGNHTLSELVAQHSATAEMLTQGQACEYLGRSRSCLQKLAKDGLAPPSIKVGRERRYLRADLDAWLAQRRKAVKS